MFASSIHQLPTINDFESAHEMFTKTPKPVTRNGQWSDNQRPLKDKRSWHYRIEQGRGGEYYDLCLYHTAMARFYAPTPEGRRVMYASYDSNTSKQFMHNVTRHTSLMHMDTTEGHTVAVPIPTRTSIHDGDRDFSASLWFDNSPHKRLDVTQSAHTPMYTHRVGPDDKALVQQVRERCEPYITLACLRIGDWRRDEYINEDLLAPFQGGVAASLAQKRAIEQITGFTRGGASEVTQGDINAFMELAERVYDYEATKLYYKARYDSEKPVTEKVLADGLWRVIVRETLQLRRKSAAVPLPQFMAVGKFPKTTATPFA